MVEGEQTGFVTEVKDWPNNHTLTIEGVKYAARGKAPCKKGDKVRFEAYMSPDGKYQNYKDLVVVASQQSNVSGNDKIQEMSKMKNRVNAKICALTCATNLCVAQNNTSEDEILRISEDFFKFIEGEGDSPWTFIILMDSLRLFGMTDPSLVLADTAVYS